ncbi:GDP dissociation inhibitor, putative [Plasmodium sp. gorilla clade G2]|uniref:GDP dissociation inhibitor, putative n=1 Tax=Plasmodium sp. gorilla clade G2 TaxID=880535 RepID=UPI000D20C3ED|nr:GDP dissociation inhibitor, putative [Plasmodium sp. gorilla clade G2]SOV15258.1 GDP dissociation inhibitor, putative [Plasmodium sp. gorilla clade G2]
MDEKNNKLFECDILICGTSLLNTLLSVYFSIKNYNVINIDKNNYYGDYNGSLNFCQFQDVHNKLEKFYYEFLPFSNLTQVKKKELQEIVQNYFKINNNKFNIDINPKIIYNESNIVNLLMSVNAHTYISFLGIQYFYLTYKKFNEQQHQENTNTISKDHTQNIQNEEKEITNNSTSTILSNNIKSDDLVFVKVPLNKSQVFLDNNLNLNEKRMIMNFIYKNIVYDKNYTFSNFSNYAFMKKGPNQSLSEDSQKVEGSLGEVKERGIQQQNNNDNINNIGTITPYDDVNDNIQNLSENVNIINYLNTFNITDKISDYIMYGIGLFDLDLGYCKNVHNIPEYYLSGFSKETKYILNKNEFLKRLHILVNSLNKFKLQNSFENAFIYPSYGLNDIIYALSRVACLNNSIYMINRKIEHITYSNYNYTKENEHHEYENSENYNTSNVKINEVILDNGFIIKPKFVISTGSNINFKEMKKYLFKNEYEQDNNIHIKTSRLLVLSTYSFLGQNGLAFYIHKQPKLKHQVKTNSCNSYCTIHILQLDYSSGSCPLGFFLTYFTYLEIETENVPNKQQKKYNNNENNHNNNYKHIDSSGNVSFNSGPEYNNAHFFSNNNTYPNDDKPLNYLLLLDVLKLFIQKQQNDKYSNCDNCYFYDKNVFNEQLLKQIRHFFNTSEFNNISQLSNINNKINTNKKHQNNEIIDKREDQYQYDKNQDEMNNILKENKEEENKPNDEYFMNQFNNLLKKEGIIYMAYYEYKPTVYRKDTIQLINQNLDIYKNIFENIEKQNINNTQEKEINKHNNHDDNENISCKENHMNNKNDELNKTKNCSKHYEKKKNTIQLTTNQNIINLLFTNDVHNYPIYPLIEDISTFIYIISKFNQQIYNSKNETIYDTLYDFKTIFNYQNINS